MWSVGVLILSQIAVCQFTTDNLTSTTEVDQTVTPYYALSTGIAPAPVMLRLGNSTIDSTKAFKVPQPTNNPDMGTSTVQPNQVNQINANIDMVPHVVSVKNTYFDHDRRYGPTFEDTPDGNITKITVQLGEDAHLNCRISLLQDKTINAKIDMVPHIVSVKNTYFDHDRRYGPTFEDTPDGNITKITVQLGEDAHLNCRISLLQDKTVSWVRRKGKDDIPELLTVGAVTYAADSRVSVGKRYPGNWRLLIREVKPDDEGVYECQISTHPPRVSRTYLHVNTPQVWVVDEAGGPLQEKYYEAESTLALMCRARHVDTPAVLTWLHEGRALNADTTRGGISVKTEQVPGGADSVLRLARVNSSDAGNYTCAVRGARPHTVSVHVLNESLAELHAGVKSVQPSLRTIVTLFIITLFLSQPLLSSATTLARLARTSSARAQGQTKKHYICNVMLLPT